MRKYMEISVWNIIDFGLILGVILGAFRSPFWLKFAVDFRIDFCFEKRCPTGEKIKMSLRPGEMRRPGLEDFRRFLDGI